MTLLNSSADPVLAVIGLGYVGLPLALAMSRRFPRTIGFDINPARVRRLAEGRDDNGDVPEEDLAGHRLRLTTAPEDLAEAEIFIVTVPTPIDENKDPDLSAVKAACRTIGRIMRQGAIVVFESTVFPGATEEICRPILAAESGLRPGLDFTVGYSPERINPGDRDHTFERIVKVVAGETPATTRRLAEIYGAVVTAGIHEAPSIKVAEAAKVIENTQRDLNIALVNEFSLIFDRLGIAYRDVLAAARTKWNFLPFTPGLVGGHCIGVDPYYLTWRARAAGYHPEIVLAGRRLNDGMGRHIAARTVKMLSRQGRMRAGAPVLVLGLTFKENVRDIRNTRVIDIIQELQDYGLSVAVHDPMADPDAVAHEYDGLTLLPDLPEHAIAEALILAVPHQAYLQRPQADLLRLVVPDGVVIDVKAALDRAGLDQQHYWSL